MNKKKLISRICVYLLLIMLSFLYGCSTKNELFSSNSQKCLEYLYSRPDYSDTHRKNSYFQCFLEDMLPKIKNGILQTHIPNRNEREILSNIEIDIDIDGGYIELYSDLEKKIIVFPSRFMDLAINVQKARLISWTLSNKGVKRNNEIFSEYLDYVLNKLSDGLPISPFDATDLFTLDEDAKKIIFSIASTVFFKNMESLLTWVIAHEIGHLVYEIRHGLATSLEVELFADDFAYTICKDRNVTTVQNYDILQIFIRYERTIINNKIENSDKSVGKCRLLKLLEYSHQEAQVTFSSKKYKQWLTRLFPLSSSTEDFVEQNNIGNHYDILKMLRDRPGFSHCKKNKKYRGKSQ